MEVFGKNSSYGCPRFILKLLGIFGVSQCPRG